MHIADRVKRSAWWMIPVVLLVLSATVVPAVAGITYNPSNTANNPAGIRLADQPRTCQDPYGCTNNSGGNFTDGEPAIASGANGATHLLYAAWTADRQGTEDTALVPYGAFNSPAAKNCIDPASGIEPFSERGVIGGVWAASKITFTVDATHVFLPGDTVAISGSSPAGYDGTYTVLASPAPTPTTFAVTNGVDPGAFVAGGFADRIGNCSQVYFARAAASRPATTTVAVTGATWATCVGMTTSHKCITYAAAGHGLVAGDTANVFGISPKEWNYSGPVYGTPLANSFQVPAGDKKFYAAPTAYVSGGSVYKNSWAWDGGKSGTSGVACTVSATWCNQYGTNAFPVSPSNQHVEGMAIASSGKYVYVMWTNTIGYYSQMCQNEPRVLWVRVNSNYGDADAWGNPIKLTAGNITPPGTDQDRVDYPSIAAKGNSVYVIHTNSNNGDIIVDESNNNGGAWTTTIIGRTSAVYDNGVMVGGTTCPGSPLATAPYNGDTSVEGYEGMPVIAATTGASGGAVGAAWQGNDAGKIVAKIAVDGNADTTVSDNWPKGAGSSFGVSCVGTQSCSQHLTSDGGKGKMVATTTCPYTAATPAGTVGACMPGNLAVDAVAGRIGFAFVNDNASLTDGPSGVFYRQWTAASGWAQKRQVACFDNTLAICGSNAAGWMATDYDDGYAPAVALYGTNGVGVNFSACARTDLGGCNHPEVLFKESGDAVMFHDGCPAGTPCGRYQIIANNRWDNGETAGADETCGAANNFQCALNSSVNNYPNILFDNPSVSGTVGCLSQGASTPAGLPVVGCKTSHYFIGRNTYYGWYRMYIVQGTQT